MQTAAVVLVLTLPLTWLFIGGAVYRRRRDGRLAPPLLRAVAYDVTAVAVALAVVVVGDVPRVSPSVGSPGPVLGVVAGIAGGLALFSIYARARPPAPSSVAPRLRRFAVQGGVTSITSVAEEIAWRGVALGTALTVWEWSEAGAVASTAALFGLLHVGLGGLRAVVTHTVTGAILGVTYVATGTLVVPIVVHVVYNLAVIARRLSLQAEQASGDSSVVDALAR